MHSMVSASDNETQSRRLTSVNTFQESVILKQRYNNNVDNIREKRRSLMSSQSAAVPGSGTTLCLAAVEDLTETMWWATIRSRLIRRQRIK